MSGSSWPNVLSGVRIALAPTMLVVAFAGSRGGFVAALVTALVTDVLDGYLARKLNAFSDLGRKLDSVADYLTLFAALGAIGLLWPDVVQREWRWFAMALGAFGLAMLFGLVRLGRLPCYHTWMSKLLVAATAVAFVPLLAGWTPVPARLVAVLQMISGVEQIAIAMLAPWHVGEMPTVWHALRLRRERRVQS